jgi:hypothetical protein
VIIATGDINIHGNLGANARALVVAMSEDGNDSSTDGSAASVTITNTGSFGASGADSSSLGIVAQGDIIVPSSDGGGCSVTATGAFTAMSGLMSIERKVRVPFPVNSGTTFYCPGTATINGSIAGHFNPNLISPVNNAGFQYRVYSYLASLFNNPPPMYPTAFDWQVSKFAPADLDCFAGPSHALVTTPESGCVA